MEKNEMKLKFCKGDFFVITLIIAASILVCVFFWSKTRANEGSVAVIYQDGELVRELPLDEDSEFTVKGAYTNKIVVKDGQVWIEESDCPGNDCVHMGKIHESGRSIVCLPNFVEIRIEGASEVDFVVP